MTEIMPSKGILYPQCHNPLRFGHLNGGLTQPSLRGSLRDKRPERNDAPRERYPEREHRDRCGGSGGFWFVFMVTHHHKLDTFDGFWWIWMDFDGTNATKTYKNCVLFLAARNHRSQPQGSLHGARPERCGVGPLPARISAESIQRSRAPLGVEKHPLCWHPGNQFVTFVLPKYAQKKVQMERLMGLMGVNKKKSKLQWFSLNFNKCIHVLHDSRFFDLRYGWICLLELCGNLPEIPGIAPEHSRMIQAGLVPVFWILLFILGAKTRVMLGFFIYKCFRLFARFALIELQV